MRLAGPLLCSCIALLVAGCGGQDDAPLAATTAEPGGAALEPKIVVQLGHQAPVIAVRWVDGGRHLASLAQDGSIVLWNVASGTLLDHAQVPLDAALLRPTGRDAPALRFHAITGGPSEDTLAVAYTAADERGAARACPGAQRSGTPWCLYRLDLATRLVTADPALPVPAADAAGQARAFPLSPDGTLRPVQNHGTGRRGLPDTSDEHFGSIDPTCTSVERCRYGVTLLSANDSAAPRAFTVDARGYFLDVDLTPDGLRMIRVEEPFADNRTRVETLDLASGRREPTFTPTRDYHHVRWVDDTRYLLGSNGYEPTDDTEDALAGVPPVLLADADCAARGTCPAVGARWQTQPLADGALVALGSLEGYCYRHPADADGLYCLGDETRPDDGNLTADPPATGLAYRAAGASDWQPVAVDAFRDQVITALQVSPDGTQLAIATRAWDRADAPDAKQVLRVWRMDVADGVATPPRLLWERVDPLDGGPSFSDDTTIRALSFSADGRRLVFTHAKASGANGAKADLYLLDTDAAARVRTISGFGSRAVAIGDDRVVGLDNGALLDLGSGRVVAQLALRTALVRAGWIARSQLLWAATADGRLLFLDPGDGALQLTMHMLPGNRFFAVAPGGRYDTNLAADSALVRWVVPDAPWQSLSAQTFMRDYYEPGLYRRLLDCRASDTCATVFKPLPAIASLNRVLPTTRITEVRTGRDASEAIVTVEVREGIDDDATNGKTRSGLYNPRLFRNGRLVAMVPREVDAAGSTFEQWRARNGVKATHGVHRLTFTVPLPTQPDDAPQVFTAYAFNEDRIKGETATFAWTRPAVTPRARHAYVLTIGIDDYDTPRFRLNYAVADARLMASRLADVPGYQTHQLVLAAERGVDGLRTRVDRVTMQHVLALLAGTAEREATLAALRAQGIDASVLRPATPDDVVIVSFSGHGWANPRGEFFLIPGDGRWPDGAKEPDLSTVFATADLVTPFHAMQAGEITLVIDACHSAASVADGRFKPGPMGDSGLGQLAYDKGIRILAATQADDVALEDARLGQGLLTYALAVDGLGNGEADLDHDADIRIDEWLVYAVRRLPTLATDARVGRIAATGTGSGARAITFSDLPVDAPARRVQQPALFDFNPQPSPVVLRREAP